jgi:hypothetical protein
MSRTSYECDYDEIEYDDSCDCCNIIYHCYNYSKLSDEVVLVESIVLKDYVTMPSNDESMMIILHHPRHLPLHHLLQKNLPLLPPHLIPIHKRIHQL